MLAGHIWSIRSLLSTRPLMGGRSDEFVHERVCQRAHSAIAKTFQKI